jgi:hypothetical protein
VIADGITAMEGNGPLQGSARQLGKIVLADDPVAADATCARLMGFDPQRVRHLSAGCHFLGNLREDRITMLAEGVGAPIPLGTALLREIDKGLAKSRIGIVLVTPALLQRLKGESIAAKELSVLLARNQLVPIVHGTTYEALRDVSPMLASRTGLSTAENPMADVAAKLAELITLSV